MNQLKVANGEEIAWQREIEEVQDRARRTFLAREIDELSPLLSDDFIVKLSHQSHPHEE